MQTAQVRQWAAENWFLVLLPFLAAISWLVARSADVQASPRAVESVTLFDWVVTVPLLYFLCYRRKLTRLAMALRLLALVCLGVWVASRLVPLSAQEVLPHLGGPRTIGLAVLALLELRLLFLALKLAFSGKADAEEMARTSGAPQLIAKLMLLEARFWKAVWRLIRRR